jgi:hypothetical protein
MLDKIFPLMSNQIKKIKYKKILPWVKLNRKVMGKKEKGKKRYINIKSFEFRI